MKSSEAISSLDKNNYGIVTQIRDEIVSVKGLYSVGINEKVLFLDTNLTGMVRSLISDAEGGIVQICVFGNT
jgi:F0F1-type ATP synthase alpha subunit